VTTVLRPERPFDRHEALLAQRTLFYRHAPSRQTDAPAALFVHGLGGSALDWTDFMGRMSSRLDCYALDLHGFGSSPPPRDGDMTPRGHARAAADFIVERDLGPVHLFGSSMGGAVSVQLAARRPDLVQSVTLISPALPNLRYATKRNIHLPVISVPGVGERLVPKFVETTSPQERVQASIDGGFADPSRMPADRFSEAIGEVEARDARPYANDAFLSSLRGLMRTYFDPGPQRPWKLAEKVVAPTLLVYGRQDPLVDSRTAHGATKHFSNAHVVVLPDSGHMAQMEHPELVEAAWDRFIAPTLDS
jgi:pimeloyl-ACP methyl ester carboxylesterase|tara:strand:- start:4331 stop:5248 length:918 start_codon:yes stop_codon:yes gene_type:complete